MTLVVGVSVPLAKLKSAPLIVKIVQVNVSAIELVPAVNVSAAIVLLLPVIILVPLPFILTDNAVYVPPLANTRLLFKFTSVVAGIQVLPLKSNILKALPLVSVGMLAPLVNARLGGTPAAGNTVIGVNALAVTVPKFVKVKLLILLSDKKLPLFDVFNSTVVCVPVISLMLVPALCVAVNGLVGGVKFPVYTATPLTIRKLLKYPFILVVPLLPIYPPNV
jgi:hypothetical protein